MSWLNKFLKVFQNKEEAKNIEEFEEIYYEKTTRNDNRGKELDAKVVYQYPKANFRFPLIPDKNHERQLKERDSKRDSSIERPKRPVKEQRFQEERAKEKDSFQETNGPKKDSFQNGKSLPIKKKESIEPSNNKLAGSNKISKKNSRPFQPTEIPSPIYGFAKRPDNTEVVEFELNDGEASNQIHTAPSPTIYGNDVKDVYENIHANKLEVAEKPYNQEIPVETIYDEQNLIIESDVFIEGSIEKEEDLIMEEDRSFADTEDSSELEMESIEDEVFLEEDIDNRAPDSVTEMEEDTESQASEFTIEMEDATGNHAYEFIAEMEEDIDNQAPESITEMEEDFDNQKTEFIAETHEDFETERNLNKVEEEAPTRSHLPFNVLMLKQDRRSLEQKSLLNKNMELPKQTQEPAHQVPQPKVEPVAEERIIQRAENILSEPINDSYIFPELELLNPPVTRFAQENVDWIENQEYLLNEALKNFGVRASVVNITQGPSVTRFEVQPEPGVKVNKITNLSDDIKLSLAAKDIRIEAPIPGKHTIGIEVPNKKSRPVLISEIIKTEAFRNSSSPLTAVLGLDISGAPIVTDLKKMPHGLIAGATGSGKSVCINSILVSLLYKASPYDLKLLLIDPKMVELAPYNHIPHLVSPVITDVKAATAALKWAVDEMERRYELFAHAGVRDINRFNEIAEEHKRYSEKLPFIVIIIDELADLMMMSPADVEESICRIAQKARACGIHLIIATQRPSVDVITGLIKANVPTRASFSVSSQIDSRTIIDISGAEKLLGKGDMLFLENGSSKPVRLQGTFVSDAEIDLVVQHVRDQMEPQYLFHQEELLKKAQVVEEEDELFYEACEYVIDQGGASTSSLQRRFKVGYNRAARLIDMMEQQGFISEPKGSKPRDVLITAEELEQIQETSSSTFL
ncbi:DNA translocase FtsK [Neobacillus sp. D3-1R]|uniref:DNA translocase FtsK n=1 Tax=Neobacillus sp. D3-1R TaxID=3445778 RepID=UPI003FA06D38